MKFIQDIFFNELQLSNSFLSRLKEISEFRLFKKKDFLLETNSPCKFIGLVNSGVLRSFREKDGEEFISDFYIRGSFVTSYRSFLNKEPSVGAIQALTDSEVYLLSRANYDILLKESPEWYKLGKYVADAFFIKKCRKETSLLMDNASDRYASLLEAYPQIELYISQYHIASYLGIKPESLSRLKAINTKHDAK